MTIVTQRPRAGEYWIPRPGNTNHDFKRVLIQAGETRRNRGVVRYWCGGQLLTIGIDTFVQLFEPARPRAARQQPEQQQVAR
jgi:hypothetical protein